MWHTPRFRGGIVVLPHDRGSTGSRRSSHRRRRADFRLECLEDRTVLSSLIVTSGVDTGHGSLRDASASALSRATIELAHNVHNITPTSGELATTTGLNIKGPVAKNTPVVAGVIVAPSADLSVTSSGPASVTAGTTATYAITVTNNGPNTARGVVLTDTLPAGAVYVSMYQTSGFDSFTFAVSEGVITVTASAGIPSGNWDTFTLIVWAPTTLPAGADFTNRIEVTSSTHDPNPGNNTALV